MGGLVGLAIVTFAASKGFLVPKDSWNFAPASEWGPEWMGQLELKLDAIAGKAAIPACPNSAWAMPSKSSRLVGPVLS